MAKIAPLKTGFLVTSMLGFLVSAIYVPQFSITWAFSFGLVFIFMFVASMISMVSGPPEIQLGGRYKKIK